MNQEEVKQRIDKLNVWKQGGQRAPHKPLLLLYALARCLCGKDRLMPYAEVDRDLRKLLAEFGPFRRSYHPEYPFWRLKNDGIWELTDGAVAVSESRVKQVEFLFIKKLREFVDDLNRETDFYSKDDYATLAETKERVLFLKDVIENKGGHRLFFVGDEPIREKQVEIYKKASDSPHGLKVILFFTDRELEKVIKIFNDLGLHDNPHVILIDGRATNKPSGSKA